MTPTARERNALAGVVLGVHLLWCGVADCPGPAIDLRRVAARPYVVKVRLGKGKGCLGVRPSPPLSRTPYLTRYGVGMREPTLATCILFRGTIEWGSWLCLVQ